MWTAPHQSWVEFHGASCWVSSTSRDTSVPLLPSNGPPEFEPSKDRRMEWSPSPVAHSSEWAAEWLCVGCSRTVDLSHVPPSGSPPCPSVRMCPRWWWMLQLPSIGSGVRDVSAVWRLVLLSHPFLRVNQWHFQRPHVIGSPRGRLYGWGVPLSQPQAAGPSHPLISLALTPHGVPLYSTGPRQPVPPNQERHD